MTQVAGLPAIWIASALLLILPFFGWIAFGAIVAWWWWKIAEAMNKPGWYGLVAILGGIIPIVGIVVSAVFIYLIAWGK